MPPLQPLFLQPLSASSVFKRCYFSEWCISASLFEASTVKTSYANDVRRLTHQRTLRYEKTHTLRAFVLHFVRRDVAEAAIAR